jgi:hypothetical protein
VHDGERASELCVVAVPAHLQILEHEKRFVARLAAAQRSRDPSAGGGERRQAIGLGGEVVELRALVDLREILAAFSLDDKAAMDTASP